VAFVVLQEQIRQLFSAFLRLLFCLLTITLYGIGLARLNATPPLPPMASIRDLVVDRLAFARQLPRRATRQITSLGSAESLQRAVGIVQPLAASVEAAPLVGQTATKRRDATGAGCEIALSSDAGSSSSAARQSQPRKLNPCPVSDV